jgi:hypothetical protein
MGFNGPAKANRTGKATANDSVMTPDDLARQIVAAFPIEGRVLEPCAGKGAFLRALRPRVPEWCEITVGRDFFDYTGKADWIVTNPPYSIYDRFLEKCLEVADNVVLLVPLSKCLKSIRIEKMVDAYGGLREVRILGGGGVAGFPFGFLTGVLHYQRGYKGPIHRSWGLEPVVKQGEQA